MYPGIVISSTILNTLWSCNHRFIGLSTVYVGSVDRQEDR